MVELSKSEMVTIRTTLPVYPFAPNRERKPIRTERLLLRQLTAEDVEVYYALRSQPEVMQWSIQGKPDSDIEQSRENLNTRLPPHDIYRFDWAICLASTGQFLGLGGVIGKRGASNPAGELGWPDIGYMLVKEAWGKGYATEFLKGFLDYWWSLPRRMVEIEVDKDLVYGEGDIKTECLVAITVDFNYPSHNVLQKCGSELGKIFEAEDEVKGKDGMVILHGFAAKRPETTA